MFIFCIFVYILFVTPIYTIKIVCNMLLFKKSMITGFLIYCLINSAFSQVANFQQDYTSLKSAGSLPTTVTIPSSRKYKKELNRISKEEKKSDRKLKKNFFLQSNFIIDDLLRSGYILYNDPLGVYVNKVADEVLKEKPVLRKKLSFYVMRSSAVNAFTTDQGIIFISIGLLSQLENEAELAFILCHEIIHYQKEHGLDLLLEVDKIDQKTSQKYVLDKTIIDKDVFKYSFSRELETEADMEGFELYKETNYDLQSLTGVFNVLAYSYLPFEDLPFKKSFFERDYRIFPDAYQIKEVKPISAIQISDDSKSTHPDVLSRKLKIKDLITDHSNDNREVYLVSKEEFGTVKETARFEMPLLSLNEESFYRAIYESYLLLQTYPNNFYLKKCIAKGLYLSVKYKNEGYNNDLDKEEIEGELQGLVHFMKQFSAKKLNIFAASYLWELHEERPEDTEIAIMAKDLLIELVYHYDSDKKDFKEWTAPTEEARNAAKKWNSESTNLSETEIEKTKSAEGENQNKEYTLESPFQDASIKIQTADTTLREEAIDLEKTKVEKIRLAEIKNEHTSYYWKTPFSPVHENNQFIKAWEEAIEENKERKARSAHYDSSKGAQEYKKYLQRKSKKGIRLGINKVVIVNPYYLKLDARKENAVLYEKAEKAQVQFHDLLKENAKLSKLKIKILDVEAMKTNDLSSFNDVAILTEWFSNQGDYSDLSVTPSLRQSEVAALAKKYGTKYFCWTGVVSLRKRKRLGPYWGILLPYAWPWVISHAIKSPNEFLLYNVIFDVETGKREVVKFQYLDTGDSNAILNMHIYDAFLQIKSK